MNQAITQQVALNNALVSTEDHVMIGKCNMRIDPTKPQRKLHIKSFLMFLSSHHATMLSLSQLIVGVDLFQEVLDVSPRVPNKYFVEPPLYDAIVTFIKLLGYKGSPEFLYDLYTDHMYQPWRTFVSIINRCLSGKTSGIDRLRLSRAQILWAMFNKKDVDFAELLWEDFQYQIDYRQTSVRRCESMPYPGFTKVIIQHFMSKHKSISRRNGLFMHSIKNDSVLGKLKFVNKGEDNQMYGMSIPDVMKVRKGTKTVATPKKKSFATADEDIIPDPEEAGRRPTGVVNIYTPNVSNKKTPDQSQKLKGMEILYNVALLEADTRKAIKASRFDYKFQQQTRGSSERHGITLEVPDEPKGKSTNTSEGAGITPEVLDVSKTKTESEREVGESEEFDEETVNDEYVHTDYEHDDDEMHADKELHSDDETQEDEYVHDAEYVHEDVETHEDANEEKDAENADKGKVDEEIANAAQANAEKTHEEKVDTEQARNNQAVKYAQVKDDNQAITTELVTQKENPDLPLSSSSLSVSSNYEIPNVQSPLLLDVPVSMIPEQTIPTPTPAITTRTPVSIIPLQVPIVIAITSMLQQSTPIPTPPITSETTTITTTVPDLLLAVIQRLFDLESKFEAWTKVDHYIALKELVQANVIHEVKNHCLSFYLKQFLT
ncbi:hypothetical protein Tco_1415975 [Tanacetum coccineum]